MNSVVTDHTIAEFGSLDVQNGRICDSVLECSKVKTRNKSTWAYISHPLPHYLSGITSHLGLIPEILFPGCHRAQRRMKYFRKTELRKFRTLVKILKSWLLWELQLNLLSISGQETIYGGQIQQLLLRQKYFICCEYFVPAGRAEFCPCRILSNR